MMKSKYIAYLTVGSVAGGHVLTQRGESLAFIVTRLRVEAAQERD
jgi:hypothetical protein